MKLQAIQACQEDIYLKELVRYIHLNPNRAGLTKDITALDDYPYAGHATIMGRRKLEWQATNTVLVLFGTKKFSAKNNYHKYMAEGLELGHQPGLTGGGLIRSAGGWSAVQQLRKAGHFQKSDERILGNGDFVEAVMAEADELMTRTHAYKARGITLDQLQQAVATQIGINPEELYGSSKIRTVSKARMLFCYWAVREMGRTMTKVAKRLNIALTTVSVAVRKGEQAVRDEELVLDKVLNVYI